MTQTLSREQINLAFDAWKRDSLIAGIAPADWQDRIEAIRTMALSHADAYERGQRDMAAAAVKVAEDEQRRWRRDPGPAACKRIADAIRALIAAAQEK